MLLRYGYDCSPRLHGGADVSTIRTADIRLRSGRLPQAERPITDGVTKPALSDSERAGLVMQEASFRNGNPVLLQCVRYGMMPPTVVCPHTDGHPLWRNLLIPGERMKRQLSMMLFFALVPSTTFPLFFLLFILPTSPGISIPTLTELL